MKFKKNDKEGIFKSLFAAYFVLILHVFLLAGTGISVVLFKGVYHYLPWILGGLSIMVLALFWVFYIKIKKSGSDMRDVLNVPEFRGRAVEIKLLGGFATVNIAEPKNNDQLIGLDAPITNDGVLRLEQPDDTIDKRIMDLAELYNNDLITKDEFDMAKKRILYDQ